MEKEQQQILAEFLNCPMEPEGMRIELITSKDRYTNT
jgi:hypothetical protein